MLISDLIRDPSVARHTQSLVPVLEELHGALMAFRIFPSAKRAQVPAFPGFRVHFSRI
jgi:hypothetical protein